MTDRTATDRVLVDVRREPLLDLWDWDRSPEATLYAIREVAAEGFPGMGPALFVSRYFIHAQKMSVEDDVTRIEWRYLSCDEDGCGYEHGPLTTTDGVTRCYVCEHEHTCHDPWCAWCGDGREQAALVAQGGARGGRQG